MPRMSLFARLTVASSTLPSSCGPMMAASSPMMTTTTMTSTSVKPRSAVRDRRMPAFAFILLPKVLSDSAPPAHRRTLPACTPRRKIAHHQEVFVNERPARTGLRRPFRQRFGTWVPVLAIAALALLLALGGDLGREALRY